MSEKRCKIENGKITLCKELYHITTNLSTKIEKVTMVRMSDVENDFIGAITFRYGRKKHDIVALSFCPICGGGLR